MSDLSLLFHHLKQPEYVHVLLNPWPIYGMVAGAFFLILALLRRREPGAALLWLILMSIDTWLAVRYGQKGYDRIYDISNEEAEQWLQVHMHRAETFQWLFYGTGLSALAALLTRRRQAVARGLAILTLVLTLLSAGVAGWIGQAGGQVRHSEFRSGPPAPGQLPKETHSHGSATGHKQAHEH